jgi:hypothetical protein
MKQILLQLFTLLITTVGFGQSCNLFFSEYLEGASNNKAIEIYNPLNISVDLNDYVIYRYNNGSPIPTDSLHMNDILAPGDVFVAGNPSAIASILAVSDTLHTITFYNGDDAMELRYKPTNTILDIIGTIGFDPGINWPVGTGATSEFTLVRQASITNGETNWAIAATEWDVYPQNTTTFIGSHTGTSCCINTFSSFSVTNCDTYFWALAGQTYTSSGSYNTTIPNAAGCDSIITLNLTILNSTTGTDVQTACNSFTWIDGNTYTASNNAATYNLVGGATNGCDSLVTLNLTILNSTTGTDTQTACNSFTWIDGNTYTSSNNAATYNIVGGAANGCDSLVTLNLTILNSTTGTDTQTACNSFTWIDGNTYTASNTTATYTLVGGAVNGCDSLVTLNLTINSVADISTSTSGVTLTANNSGATYQWLDCNNNNAVIAGEIGQSFTAIANGNYAVEITENGCIDTSACAAITTVGIIENSFGDELVVYPNPTNGDFSINLGSSYENAQVIITDISGKLIESKNSIETQVINISMQEPAGIYLVSVQSDDRKVIIRLIKE